MERARTAGDGRARDPSAPAAARRSATPPLAPDHAQLVRIQRAAGNRTATAAVQRLGGKKDHAELVRDGAKGDVDAINEIQDFTSVAEADRLNMVFFLTDQFWVRSASEKALERIWNSFGPGFADVAGGNWRRWQASVARHSKLPSAVPAADKVYKNFGSDVSEIARDHLKHNGEFAADQSSRLGVAPGSPAKPETDAEVNSLQTAAAEVAKLQFAQKVSRQAWVGYEEMLDPRTTEERRYFRRVLFEPGKPPPITDLAGQRGTINLDDGELTDSYEVSPEQVPALQSGLRSYDDLLAADVEAGATMTNWLLGHPVLGAVVAGGPDATASFASAKGGADAKKQLADAFVRLQKNITESQNKLGGDLDPLDFTPIHDQLFAKKAAAKSGIDWSTPFAKQVAQRQTTDHNISRTLRTLLLQKVSELAFLLAPLTGGASLVALLVVGAGSLGTNLVLDAQRYGALAAAKGSAAQPGTDIVSAGVVDEAKMAMESDAVALALAIHAIGKIAATKLMESMRAARLARIAELPEGFVTGRVKGLYEGLGPAAPKVGGLTFTDGEVTTDGRFRVTRIEVRGPDGSIGHVERAWNPATGEVQFREADLANIDKSNQWVQTEPPLREGKGTPLSTYMNMRAMRVLGVPPGGIRVVRLTGIQNIRSVI